MTVSIESFGGKPYRCVVEVLERDISTTWPVSITDISVGFGADDRKLKNIEMTDDGYIECGEYRYISIMPYFKADVAIPAGSAGTLNLENQIWMMLREGSYHQAVHQTSMFPGHYEYDNSSGGSTYTDTIYGSVDFNHPEYYSTAQMFELLSNQVWLNIHVTKQNIQTAFHTFRLILWLIP